MASGNSLDFNLENEEWKNWNEKGYSDFTKRVGWKEEDGEWRGYEELPMNLRDIRDRRVEVSRMGELPLMGWVRGIWDGYDEMGNRWWGGSLPWERWRRRRFQERMGRSGIVCFFMQQRLANCSR